MIVDQVLWFKHCSLSVTILNSTLSLATPISTWMCYCWQEGKQSQYATSHPGQLSLVVPVRQVTMSTTESQDVNMHLCNAVLQCMQVSD